ncbi:hypothetical protein NPIL_668391 [Nephila pilipes]|uniref:Uncharacterized protein n=1 Tax=Nephila pilipes TaxID=299642 RepID=A0A8X6NHT9_NEPPI|nr:hypothetical protein NPIL_668391 [Nephila pilipes]
MFLAYRGENSNSEMDADNETVDHKKNPKLLETSFLLTVTGVSIIGGFGMALAMAKKRDPVYFFKVKLLS